MTPTAARQALARIGRDARKYPADPIGFAERVRELIGEGLDRGDAEDVAEAERMSGTLAAWAERIRMEAA